MRFKFESLSVHFFLLRFTVVLALMLAAAVTGCAKKTTTAAAGAGGTSGATGSTGPSEDVSVSGTAASVIGGLIGSTVSAGKVASTRPGRSRLLEFFQESSAFAATGPACPTLLTAGGSGCTQLSGSQVSLTQSSCSNGTSTATWTGAESYSIAPSGTITCGAFPTVPDNSFLCRGFDGTRKASSGTVVTVDSGNNLTNYEGASISGGGACAIYSGNLRTKLADYGVRVTITGKVDHTTFMTTSIPLNISDSTVTKTVTGNLTVYDNLEKVTGLATFTNVIYEATCCTPTAGSISTTFSVGPNGNATSTYAGKTETLTFIGVCGTATLTAVDGTSKSVLLSHCL